MTFDRLRITNGLDALPRRYRAIFAALVVDRLFPAYVAFAGRTKADATVVAELRRDLWSDAFEDETAAERAAAQVERALEAIPGEEFSDIEGYPQAEDAVAALTFALMTVRDGTSENALLAAQRAYEACDNYVTNLLNIDTFDAESEERILRHPVVQRELEAQVDQLNALANIVASQMHEAEKIATLKVANGELAYPWT